MRILCFNDFAASVWAMVAKFQNLIPPHKAASITLVCVLPGHDVLCLCRNVEDLAPDSIFTQLH